MLEGKIKKKHIRIFNEFVKMTENGSQKMAAYKYLAKKHRMSVGGVRYAIANVRYLARPVAPPLTDEELRMGILCGK